MKINKTKLTATIVTVLLMLSAFTLTAIPLRAQDEGPHGGSGALPSDWETGEYAEEQPVNGPLPSGVTPEISVDTRAFLSFRPNPIGLNQQLLVNMWLNPALNRHRFHPGYRITITQPDGTPIVFSLDSYVADTTSYFEYAPNQAGEWTIKFEFLGTYFPAGQYYNGYVVTNSSGENMGSAYYRASSQEHTFVVQEDIVYSWPPSPLPTDYWTRPVAIENREWWPILGNYPGAGYQGGGSLWDELYPNTNPVYAPRYNFHPWVIGPNSAHIVWKRQDNIAGMLGGPAGQFHTRGSASNPRVVYAGRAYGTYTKPGVGSVAACYDLRTGETYYEIPTAEGGVTPRYIVYYPPGPQNIPGAEATSSWSVELIDVSGGNLLKVNPITGAVSSYSISPLTGSGGTFVNQIGGYFYAAQDLGPDAGPEPSGGTAPWYDYLGNNWVIAEPGNERYRVIKWTTQGSTNNFANRVLSNTTTEWTTGGVVNVVSWRTSMDFNTGVSAATPYPEDSALGTWWNIEMHAINTKTGEHLWSKTIPGETVYSGTTHIADHGKFAVLTQQGVFMAYDLLTGNFLWESEQMDYPWSSAGFGAYSISSAYGLIFRATYAGVYAFNWTNGEIAWKYAAPAFAHFETPYITDGVEHYSFNSQIHVADGKLYTWNSEHSESYPATRGWGLHCINVTTGEGIWEIKLPGSIGVIADGYMTVANQRDGYMYVFGKGQSATTVTALPKTVAKGASVVIEGTVLDMSPAQPGTPCVSKESMTTQMEYIHKQLPIDGIWNNQTATGVPVKLTATGSDGSVIDIGTTTTEGYHGTFGFKWTPPDEDTYKIVASFEGDDSYGSSGAATYVSVGPAPSPAEPETEPPTAPPTTEEPTTAPPTSAPPTTEEPTTAPPTSEEPTGEAPFPTTEVIIVAAVAVATVIGIGAYWILRKRK